MRRVRSGSVLQSVVGIRFSAVLLVAAVVVMAAPVAAWAAPKVGVATIGGPALGTTGGLFNNPRGVAINQSGAGGVGAGTIYVADSSNNRIQRFNANGSFDSTWGQDVDSTAVGTGFEVCTALSGNVCKAGATTPVTGGAMNAPQDVAVDQNDGSVYVIDQGNRRVQKFTSTGVFVWAAGWDVVSSGLGNDATGTLNQYETCVAANGDVCKIAAAAGADAGRFGAAATGIAVNPSNGQVVVADATNKRVQKISSAGAFVSAAGYDVIATGQAGDTGVALEVCPAGAAQVTGGCRAGQTTNGGINPGQFAANQPTDVATDSGGAIYAMDSSANSNRVQRLTASGSGAAVFAAALVSGTPGSAVPVSTRVVVDQSNDHVYVVKGTAGILEFDSFGSYLETHAATASLPANSGLDLRSPGGNLYYATTTNHRIVVLGTTAAAPTATQDEVTVFTPTTATFSGTVNPTGLVAGYHFEYRRDQDPAFTKFPAADADAGPVNTTNPVSQNATGLTPNTLYHVRLVATKLFGGGTATTPEVTFTTPVSAPTITTVKPDDLSDTTATLTARIDPNNQDTNYRFEYGPADCATNPCTNTPIPNATLPANAPNTYVTQPVTGLAPNTTYHFRVVATNTTATTNSPDQTLTTTNDPVPSTAQTPDGYELVSPPGGQRYVLFRINATPHSWSPDARVQTPDGRCVSYVLGATFAAGGGTLPGMAADGEAPDPIVACRTADGWTARSPAGDRTNCSYNGSTDSAGNADAVLDDMAVDASRAVMTVGACNQSRLKLSAGLDQQPLTLGGDISPPDKQGKYGVELDTDSVSYLTGAYDAFGPIPRTDFLPTLYLGASSDLNTTYFASRKGLLPGIVDAGPTDSYIYRRAGGVTTLMTRSSAGTPVTWSISPASGFLVPHGTVSVDGPAVSFTTPGSMSASDANSVTDVYQVRGDQVIWASNTAFTGAAQPAAARTFVAASADGHQIFFSTTEKLVGNGTSTGDLNAVADVYVYDEDAPVGQELSLVSVADPGCTVACTTPASTTAATFSLVSPDGSHVFFTTASILDPQDADGQASLYVRNLADGTTTYVAPAGSDTGSLTGSQPLIRPILTSSDGTAASFMLATNVSLPAGRGGDDLDGQGDMFVWHEGYGLRRVRQGPGPDDNTTSGSTIGCLTGGTDTVYNCPGITGDGRLVYFTTKDSLSAADSDGGFDDVYAVDTRSGRVRLISPAGSTPFNATFTGNSLSGSDVFFITREVVDPSRDSDGSDPDMYVARTGVPVFDPAPVDACVEDACQGPAGDAPGGSNVGTTSPSGDGNTASGVRNTLLVAGLSAAARKRAARSGTVRLRIRTGQAGSIALSAKARLGGRSVRVAAKSVRVSKPGATTVALRLSRRARKALKAGKRLRLTVVVTQSGARSRSIGVLLPAVKS